MMKKAIDSILVLTVLSLVVISVLHDKVSLACCGSWTCVNASSSGNYAMIYADLHPELGYSECWATCNYWWRPYGSARVTTLTVVSPGDTVQSVLYYDYHYGTVLVSRWQKVTVWRDGQMVEEWACVRRSDLDDDDWWPKCYGNPFDDYWC